MSDSPRTITVAFTGASGMPYGLRLVECLLAAGCRVWLLYSQVAQIVARQEMDWALPGRAAELEAELGARFATEPGQLRVFGREEGSLRPPRARTRRTPWWCVQCTMGTLAAIAAGMSQNLIERAADVVVKEGASWCWCRARARSRRSTSRTCSSSRARRVHPAAQPGLLPPPQERR